MRREIILQYAIALILVGGVADSFAQEDRLEPGEYLMEAGSGSLMLKSSGPDPLLFEIETVGANAHLCSLAGSIVGDKATLTEHDKSKPCVVTFQLVGEGVEVWQNSREACGIYCGARAGFEGLYLKPAPGCMTAEISSTRAAFKALYDDGSYTQAEAVLQPLLQKCIRTLHWTEEGWIRNDLAITQYKLGKSAACRNTLEPLKDDALAPEDETENHWQPVDSESYRPILKATRTNLDLCGQKIQKK